MSAAPPKRPRGRPAYDWTEPLRARLEVEWMSRHPMSVLVERFGCSSTALRTQARVQGLGRRPHSLPRPDRDEDEDARPCLVVWASTGRLRVYAEERAMLGTASDRAVGEAIGRPREWCARARAALGIPADHNRTPRRQRDAEMRAEVERWRGLGASIGTIAEALGVPPSQVERVGCGVSRSFRWDELAELLEVLGPLTFADLRRIWDPDPGRHLGGYLRDGWLRRRQDGAYELTGAGPGARP